VRSSDEMSHTPSESTLDISSSKLPTTEEQEKDDPKSKINYDKMVRKLYHSMKYNYEIEPDKILLSVLNRLFSFKISTSSGVFSTRVATCKFSFWDIYIYIFN